MNATSIRQKELRKKKKRDHEDLVKQFNYQKQLIQDIESEKTLLENQKIKPDPQITSDITWSVGTFLWIDPKLH